MRRKILISGVTRREWKHRSLIIISQPHSPRSNDLIRPCDITLISTRSRWFIRDSRDVTTPHKSIPSWTFSNQCSQQIIDFSTHKIFIENDFSLKQFHYIWSFHCVFPFVLTLSKYWELIRTWRWDKRSKWKVRVGADWTVPTREKQLRQMSLLWTLHSKVDDQ